MRHKIQRRFVLFTILVIIATPLLIGQQGCEGISIPTLVNFPETETIEVRGTKIDFFYDEGGNLKEIAITNLNEGVRGKGMIDLIDEKGEILQSLYKNFMFNLLQGVKNRTFFRKGSTKAKAGDQVRIWIQFTCLIPLSKCSPPKDFLGTYVLGSGQKVVE